jgi:CTP:molybdopterin cytidylyltransferase MocA
MSNVEDITIKHMPRWMEGLSESVRLGVRIIAEYGPVIDAQLLSASGIDI